MRPPSDIQGKGDYVGVVLHEESAEGAQHAADQDDSRQEIEMESQFFGQTFNGKWELLKSGA